MDTTPPRTDSRTDARKPRRRLLAGRLSRISGWAMTEDNCRLCTLEGYERVAETPHFYVVRDPGIEYTVFVTPRAHIELMELHELFAAELWSLVREETRSKDVWLSGGNAQDTFTDRGHGYLCIAYDPEGEPDD